MQRLELFNLTRNFFSIAPLILTPENYQTKLVEASHEQDKNDSLVFVNVIATNVGGLCPITVSSGHKFLDGIFTV